MAALSAVPVRAHVATFVRSFAIQGSWNYRTMLGQGFAFALLPVLRHVHAGDREGLENALTRHADYFNAHPYLAEVALGAVARMEADGADPEAIQRFKSAVRGPLGGLGDRLVWVGAVPAIALAALVAAVGGAPIWVPPVLFLVAYNLGHITLRIWAYRAGLQEGARVAGRLRRADLSRYARWLSTGAIFLLGSLVGLAALRVAGGDSVPGTTLVLAAAAGTLGIGVLRGQEAWRWAVLLTAVLVGAGLFVGALG